MTSADIKISVTTEVLLFFAALVLDLLQLFLVLFAVGVFFNTILSLLFYFALGLVMYFHHVPFKKPGRIKKFVASVIGESIPLANMLPWLTISTVLNLRDVRKEVRQLEEQEAIAAAEAGEQEKQEIANVEDIYESEDTEEIEQAA